MAQSPGESQSHAARLRAQSLDGVSELLIRVPRPPGAPAIAGASVQALQQLERKLGHALPPQMASWLKVCNGAVAGPGVLYGARPDDVALDIAQAQNSWPTWAQRGWIPVASDGSGNNYVIRRTSTEATTPVFFVDCSDDPDQLAYVVASSLGHFLRFLLTEELDRTGWPFSADYVTTLDPLIVHTPEAPLPWAV